MMPKSVGTRKLVITGMLAAITFILAVTNLGFISVGPVSVTTMHLPVLIGTLAEGPIVGLVLAVVFGGISFWKAFSAKSPIDMLFQDPLVAFPSRILIPLVLWGSFVALTLMLPNNRHKPKITWAISAALGSLTNSIGTIFMLYIRHVNDIESILPKSLNVLFALAIFNIIAEMILSVVIAPSILMAIRAMPHNKDKEN